jgi:hypothetical protein
MKFTYGDGGALLCDEAIEGVTQELNDETARAYGGRFFIGESMSRKTAEKLAEALGGSLEGGKYELRVRDPA